MKKTLLVAILFQAAYSQYTVQSSYLQNPQLLSGYADSCAKFWMKAYEPVYGGFYQNIDQMGNLKSAWGTNKNTLNQSRDAYGFTRAFQLTGDTTYLRYAKYGLDFMYAHAWDQAYGGWINSIGMNGAATSPNENKSSYFQHYALLGIAAHYEATRDTADWNWLMKGYDYNNQKLWDSSADNFGYFDYVAANGAGPADKSFNATVDAVTTHVLGLYLMTGQQQYRDRLLQLADNMIDRLAGSAAAQQIGFAEKYTTDWQIRSSDNNNEKMTIMGHVLKTAWCLARLYQFEKNESYLATAENLVQSVLEKGYDHTNGGPYKDYDRTTGQMLMWGQADTAKAWWQMEQAVTSGLMLYQITGNEKYLQMADETLNFFMTYFVDHVYGEVYSDRTKYGKQIWGLEKGSDGKAAYHSIELAYYSYLYGELFVNKQPATLFYKFEEPKDDRSVVLNPISTAPEYLKIVSVMRNGSSYADFDSVNRTLTLPAGTGGVFAVTFQPAVSPSSVAAAGTELREFALDQNYPNPFNPATTIRYRLARPGTVVLKIYDLLGREVAVLVNEMKGAGNYSVSFDGSNLPSGIYFARLHSGHHDLIKKMVLMK